MQGRFFVRWGDMQQKVDWYTDQEQSMHVSWLIPMLAGVAVHLIKEKVDMQ